MDLELLKKDIAQKDGFDTWKQMIECFCTTESGRKVIDKNINDLVRRAMAKTSSVPQANELLPHVIKSACANKPILKCAYWYQNKRGCIDCKKKFKQAVL